MTYRVLDLFSAAAGGWSLGMHRAGFKTVAACEIEEWRRVLYSENFPGVPVYEDVQGLTADRLGRDLGYLPEVVVGSPPCQDISSANAKGKGVDGERSSLFFDAIRIAGEIKARGGARWVALENSANLRTKGSDRVLAELEKLGYACWPLVVRARDVGANHERPRVWIIGFDVDVLTDANGHGWSEEWRRRRGGIDVPHAHDPDGGPSSDSEEIGRQQGFGGSDESYDAGVVGRVIEDGHDPRRASAHVDAPRLGHEGGRPWGYWSDGLCPAPVEVGDGHLADADVPRLAQREGERRHLGTPAGQTPERDAGAGAFHVPDTDRDGEPDGAVDAEMGGCAGTSGAVADPWADWNGGLATHLRVDDGLSAWVAGARIAVGGPRGTSAAALLVEAFGDAVVPQITEAIGRAILRTEAALAAIYGRSAA